MVGFSIYIPAIVGLCIDRDYIHIYELLLVVYAILLVLITPHMNNGFFSLVMSFKILRYFWILTHKSEPWCMGYFYFYFFSSHGSGVEIAPVMFILGIMQSGTQARASCLQSMHFSLVSSLPGLIVSFISYVYFNYVGTSGSALETLCYQGLSSCMWYVLSYLWL